MVEKFDWPVGQREDGFPIEPFDDVVYIEQVVEEKTKGGLIIANTNESKMPMGKVVAVGPGRFYYAPFNVTESMASIVFVPSRLKLGDMVTWGRYSSGGEPKLINGKVVVAAREGDLGGRVVAENADIRAVQQ